MTDPTPKPRKKNRTPQSHPRPDERLVFDNSIEFTDPNPGVGWAPSPEQIAAWTAIILEERRALWEEAGVIRERE